MYSACNVLQDVAAAFSRGSVDAFDFTCAELGTLRLLRIWHDNSGVDPGWHLEKVADNLSVLSVVGC